MRKNTILKALTTITVLSTSLPAGSAFAAPPVYRANVLEDVMITVVRQSEPYLEFAYNRTPDSPRDSAWTPTYLNFQIGEITDYELHRLYNGEIKGNIIVWRGLRSELSPYKNITDGDVIAIKSNKIYARPGFRDSTRGIIDYFVNFYDVPQRSRADYRRCLNASVYDAETMECRMEDLGNGFVQYQPYLLDGTRVEIPAAEDAKLTKITEEWRAEPGDWGPEWYVDDDDNGDDDSGDDDSGDDDSGKNSGGNSDGGDEGNSNEPAEEEHNEAGNEETSETTNSNVGGESNSGADVIATNVGTNTGAETNAGTNTNTRTGVDAGTSADAGTGASESENGSASTDDPSNEMVVESEARMDVAYSTEINNGADKIESSEDKTENYENKTESDASETENDGEKVGIPNLGKESENQPNWTAIIAISVASVAGLVGWLSLFFGRKILTKRKERGE